MTMPKDRNLLEATLQNIEVAVDAATSNEAIASIPIIGTAFKVCKGIDDLRARAFAAKLERFVSSPDLIKESTRKAIIRRVAASPEEAHKIGETLFLVLDRFIDLDKPVILAKVFVAYVDGVLSAVDLQRLAQAIDIAFAGDLNGLLQADQQMMSRRMDGSRYPWMETLIPSGLAINNAGGVGLVRVSTDITPLGQLLWNAWHHEHQEL